MLLAYIVYILLLLFMVGYANLSVSIYKKNTHVCYWNFSVIIPIAVFTLVLGLRYNVGTDYLSYYSKYISQFNFVTDIPWEPCFVFLYRILCFFDAPVVVLFLIVSCIQILLVYKIFEDKIELLPYGIMLVFISSHIFSMLNTLRQDTAILLLILCVRYINSSQFNKSLLCLSCASLFHISSLLFLPVLFLYKINKLIILDSKWLLLSMLFFSIISQGWLYNTIVEQFINLLSDITHYDLPMIGGHWKVAEGSGYGRIVNYVVIIILILSKERMYRKFGLPYLQYFRIYYVGQIITIIAGLDMNLRRIASCYKSVGLIVLAYFLYFVFSNWKILPVHYRWSGCFILCVYTLIFLYKIYIGESLCSPFQFAI